MTTEKLLKQIEELQGKTPVTLLVKLGSIVVHTEEMLSPDGHHFDRIALQSLLDDTDVRSWLAQMDKMSLLPKKRK